MEASAAEGDGDSARGARFGAPPQLAARRSAVDPAAAGDAAAGDAAAREAGDACGRALPTSGAGLLLLLLCTEGSAACGDSSSDSDDSFASGGGGGFARGFLPPHCSASRSAALNVSAKEESP